MSYLHFDKACLYGSEEALGRAVAEALHRGLIKSREQVFITSKLWCTETHPDLKRTLWRLGMDYLDLYLIHLPVMLKKKNVNGDELEELSMEKEDIIPFDMRGTWEGMEECCRLGLTKSIGVSNLSCTKILNYATIPPAVNQSSVLKDIAIHKQKSVAQVALRWVYEQGASVIVKSFNKEWMKENIQILDWELTSEEIASGHDTSFLLE